MTCLIPLAALCLFASEDISLYADASFETSGKGYAIFDEGRYHPVGQGHQGRIGIAIEPRLTSEVQLRLGWEHTSLLDTDRDRGRERLYIGFTWRPFR